MRRSPLCGLLDNVVRTTLNGDGIRVEEAATGAVLRRNLASGHADDGIEAASPTALLARPRHPATAISASSRSTA